MVIFFLGRCFFFHFGWPRSRLAGDVYGFLLLLLCLLSYPLLFGHSQEELMGSIKGAEFTRGTCFFPSTGGALPSQPNTHPPPNRLAA